MIYILKNSVLDDTGLRVSLLLALLFADITEVMLLSPMLGQVIGIVEAFVEAILTVEMIGLLMLVILIPSVQLLLEQQHGLVLNTQLTMVHVMSFVQMLLKRWQRWKLANLTLALLARLAIIAKVLLDKVLACHIFEVEFILCVTNCLRILFQAVVLISGDEHFDIGLLAIWAFFVLHLDPLT
jgi:hypothetical protein